MGERCVELFTQNYEKIIHLWILEKTSRPHCTQMPVSQNIQISLNIIFPFILKRNEMKSTQYSSNTLDHQSNIF